MYVKSNIFLHKYYILYNPYLLIICQPIYFSEDNCKKCYRWLVFCHVPVFCDSLPHFETTLVFGRTLLRAVFRSVRRQLMDKCHSERDRMPPEKRVLVLTHFPK